MPDDAFARALRERRRALDLTQADFARHVGCATITLKRIETGTLKPSRQLAERMLRLLELPAAERAALLTSVRTPRRAVRRNPYKGLRAFGEDDAADFFGREALVARLLARLAPPARFLAVIGPSGSGKSSVVRAGLVPALRADAHPDQCPTCVITPGARPLAALDAALANAPTLLVVDQFEELWALCPDEAERVAFLHRLVELTLDACGPLVIVTLRADFYDRPLRYHAFGALLREHTEVVLPLAPDEIARAVADPAERAGISVEPALVAACVAGTEQRPGALPLLQYALTELFERRSGGVLSLSACRAIGGIGGALAGRVDELYEALDENERMVARQLFLRLVQPGEGSDATRRRIALAELPGGAETAYVVELFARHRLLTLDREASGATVELAHEALIDGWGLLREWIDSYRDELRTHRRLAHSAAEWHAAARDPSFLANGARLAQFEALAAIELNADEQAFVDASVAERERRMAEEVTQQQALREALAQSEARRLAAEALKLLRENGSAELIALLALKSLELRYTPQGDEALCGATLLDMPLRHFSGHSGRIYCVAYAPNGETVITGGQDLVVRQWNVATGAEVRRYIGHTGNVRRLTFAPDSSRIASCGDDRTARIWDTWSGEQRLVLPHQGELNGVAFSPDGRCLLTCGIEPLVRQWDTLTGELVSVIDTGAEMVSAVAYTPDGTTVVTCLATGPIMLWPCDAPPTALVTMGSRACSVCITPDGEQLLTAHPTEQAAYLHDIRSGELLQVYRGHADIVQHASLTSDASLVITSSNDSSSRVWERSTGVEVRRFAGHNNLIWQHDASPDGRFLITAGMDGTATMWALEAGVSPCVLRGHTVAAITAVFTSDGRYVVTAGEDRLLNVWDSATGRKLYSWHVLPDIVLHGGMDQVPGKAVVVLGCDDGIGRVVELETGTVLQRLLGHHGRIWGVAVSPDARRVLTTGSDRTARLWDINSGEPLHLLAGHTDLVVGATFSPDGRYAITGSDDGTVRLWDVESGREEQRLIDSRFPMVYAAACPDGRHLLAGSADGTLRLWDVSVASEVWRVHAHHGYINSVRLSRDGKQALTAGMERVARLWDVASGTELRRFAGHTGAVYAAVFSPDERRVLTSSGDHTARLWPIDWGVTAEKLRSRLLRDFTPGERAQYGIPAAESD